MAKRKMVKHKTENVWACDLTYSYNDLKDTIKENQKRIKELDSSRKALEKIVALERKLADAKCAYNQSIIDDINKTINEIKHKIKKYVTKHKK